MPCKTGLTLLVCSSIHFNMRNRISKTAYTASRPASGRHGRLLALLVLPSQGPRTVERLAGQIGMSVPDVSCGNGANALSAARARGIPAVEMEAATVDPFAAVHQRPVLGLMHVDNIMGRTDCDFAQVDADSSTAALLEISVLAEAVAATW